MWTELPLPPLPEPITAVSLPTDSKLLYVWAGGGVYRMKLGGTLAWKQICDADKARTRFRTDDARIWQYGSIVCTWVGVCGEREFPPDEVNVVATHRFGDRVIVTGSTVRLDNPADEVMVEVNDFDGTQPLAVAGFHRGDHGLYQNLPVSDHFTIATTNRVRVFQYKGRSQTKALWQTSGNPETHDDLIRSIVADPDDDGLRLIYADWLEERGDIDRAKFIRLQVRIADRERTDVVMPNDPDVVTEAKMINDHGAQWRRQFPKVRNVAYGPHPYVNQFWRGFPKLEIMGIEPIKLPKLLLLQPADAAGVFFENWMSDREIHESYRLLAHRLRHVRIHHAFGFIVLPQRQPDSTPHLRLDLFPNVRYLSFEGSFLSHCQINKSLLSTTHLHLEYLKVNLEHENREDGPLLTAIRDVRRFPQLKTIVLILEVPPADGDGLAEIARLYPNVYFGLRYRRYDEPYTRVRP